MRLPKLSALFLTTAIAMGMSGQANALDVGQKGPFAQIDKELSQERQVEVARAKYVLNADNPSKAKTLCVKFTINAEGDAYILMSDNMDDSKATMQVVYGKLKNARAYDPRNVGTLPTGLSPQSKLATELKFWAQYGDGVMLYGQSVKKQIDGSEAVVGTTTVLANMSGTQDKLIKNRIGILVTNMNDSTKLDPVVAGDLQYRGSSSP